MKTDDNQIKTNQKAEHPLFIIANLKAYYENSVVLEAHNVSIPRNKITVLLGPSGSGKSTLLEILGLMNNNFVPESRVRFFPKPDGTDEKDLLHSWKPDTEHEITCQELRQDYYSFVFQSTNFMSNFTALENVVIGSLIQGERFQDVKDTYQDLLSKTLSIADNPNDTSSEYSGGQKQRMAFARGMGPKKIVLFGDEPTGNLDSHSADQLWQVLRESIDESPDDNITAIIVSHSIELALKYADNIIVLTKSPVTYIAPTVAKTEEVYEGLGYTITPLFTFTLEEEKWKDSSNAYDRMKKMIELLIQPSSASLARLVNRYYQYRFANIPSSETRTAVLKVREHFFQDIDQISKDLKTDDPSKLHNSKKYIYETCEKYIQRMYVKYLEENNLNPVDFSVGDFMDHFSSKRIDTNVYAIKDFFEKIASFEKRHPVKGVLDHKNNCCIPGSGCLLNGNASCNISLFEKDEAPPRALPTYYAGGIHRFFYNTCLLMDSAHVKFWKIFNRSAKLKSSNNHLEDFKKLLYRQESRTLLGKKQQVLFGVQIIILLLVLVLGFTFGVGKFADSKLRTPYDSFLDGYFKGAYYDDKEFLKRLQEDSVKAKEIGISYYNYYKEASVYFKISRDSVNELPFVGQYYSYTDDILKSLVDPEKNRNNYPRGTGFLSSTDNGIIITWSFYNRIHPSKNPISDDNPNKEIIPFVFVSQGFSVPIRAIVKGLPGDNVEFIATHYFSNYLDNYSSPPRKPEPFIVFKNNKTRIADTLDLFSNIQYYSGIGNYLSYKVPEEYIGYEDGVIKDSILNNTVFQRELENIDIDRNNWSIQYLVESDNTTTWLQKIDIANFDTNDHPKWRFYVDLNNINECESFIKSATKTEFFFSPDAKRAASNFALITTLTGLLSFVLFFLSSIFVNSILSKLLSNHLISIKMNIGTFQAFGVQIQQIYNVIMRTFLLLPLLIAILIGFIAGSSYFFLWIMNIFAPAELERNPYFTFNSWIFWVALLALLIYNFIRFNSIIRKYTQVPPSVLIYDKEYKFGNKNKYIVMIAEFFDQFKIPYLTKLFARFLDEKPLFSRRPVEEIKKS
ncbi:MAG: ABC transporter ATP-binding protein [Bacteroidia bacterium]|nr:ABC transporter ATP-binding protein [Bacteroidia bacterium]